MPIFELTPAVILGAYLFGLGVFAWVGAMLGIAAGSNYTKRVGAARVFTLSFVWPLAIVLLIGWQLALAVRFVLISVIYLVQLAWTEHEVPEFGKFVRNFGVRTITI